MNRLGPLLLYFSFFLFDGMSGNNTTNKKNSIKNSLNPGQASPDLHIPTVTTAACMQEDMTFPFHLSASTITTHPTLGLVQRLYTFSVGPYHR